MRLNIIVTKLASRPRACAATPTKQRTTRREWKQIHI